MRCRNLMFCYIVQARAENIEVLGRCEIGDRQAMCGRFAQTKVLVDLINKYRFLLADPAMFDTRYNIAPTNTVPVCTDIGLFNMRWGLVPHWAKDSGIGAKLINARSETLAEKPSFREAFKKRRCLVPASGFYEWKKEGGVKIPHYFSLADGSPFVFAALWENWRDANGQNLRTFTIATTTANALVRPIHERMPVIFNPPDAARWLAPATTPDTALELLRPYPAGDMIAYPVSSRVNATGYDAPDCVETDKPEIQGELF